MRRFVTSGVLLVLSFLPLMSKNHVGAAPRSLLHGSLALTVDHNGLYRLNGAYLQAHGVDWSGVAGSQLAVTLEGKPVPRFVSTEGPLTASSYVEFYGHSAQSRYTSSDVYLLQVDRARALPVSGLQAAPGAGPVTTTYQAAVSPARRSRYDPLGPGDGWFFQQLNTTGSRTVSTHHLALPNLVRAGQASLKMALWGVTHLQGPDPQHHVQVLVNGHQVAEIKFSGATYLVRRASFDASWLRRGEQTVQLVLPGDVHNQYNVDIVDVQSFTLTYPGVLRATSGRLYAWIPGAKDVEIAGLRSAASEVWMIRGRSMARLTGVEGLRRGAGYVVHFAAPGSAHYAVSDAGALLQPKVLRWAPATDWLVRGKVQLLIIGPQSLLQPLRPLVAYHRAHGMSVKTVPISAVYARYSGSVVDPAAIRSYIAVAVKQLGTRDVLLVGGDTYDYRHYFRCSRSTCSANPVDASYVPSLYARDDNYGQIPSDELLVDAGAGPAVAIARLPAISAAQVRAAVTKTLTFLQRPPTMRAVFAAGNEESGDQEAFQSSSDMLASILPSKYSIDRAYPGANGASAARQLLLRDINAGATLVDYVGHGNLEQWGQPPPLLDAADVPKLANDSAPGLFLGWGCQTAYYVDPTDAALNARLLFAPHGGAFLTIGSTGLDAPVPQAMLAQSFFTELFRDPAVATVGEALQAAESRTLQADPGALQPVQSYEIFGDPAIPVAALRSAASHLADK